jgi:uncharacterized iron-regulated membrane protein
MVGIAGLLGGLVVTDLGEASATGNRSVHVAAGFATAGAGLVLYLTGLIVTLNAVPHLYDAVNAFNDGLPPPATP